MTPESEKELAIKLRKIRDTFGVMWESCNLNAGEKELLYRTLLELSGVIRDLGFDVQVGRENDEGDLTLGNSGEPRGWKGLL